MKRRLFNFAAMMSGIAVVAFGALWVRTYYRTDTFYISDCDDMRMPVSHINVASGIGAIGVLWGGDGSPAEHRRWGYGSNPFPTAFLLADSSDHWRLHIAGIQVCSFKGTYERELIVIVSIWLLMLLGLPLPLLWLRRWRKTRARGRGFSVLQAQ